MHTAEPPSHTFIICYYVAAAVVVFGCSGRLPSSECGWCIRSLVSVSVLLLAFFGGLLFCWFATLAEDEKRSSSAHRDWWYFRIYKDAVWQCHGINRELVFGEKTSALSQFGRCRWFSNICCLVFSSDSYNRRVHVYIDKHTTRTKACIWPLLRIKLLISKKDYYFEDFCGLKQFLIQQHEQIQCGKWSHAKFFHHFIQFIIRLLPFSNPTISFRLRWRKSHRLWLDW